MQFKSRFDNLKNFLILFHSSRKHKEIMFTYEFDNFDWLSPFYSEWRQTSKLVNFQDFCWGLGMQFKSRFDNHWDFLVLFYSSRRHKEIMFTFEYDHFDWLSQFYSEWRQTSKLVNFQDFC